MKLDYLVFSLFITSSVQDQPSAPKVLAHQVERIDDMSMRFMVDEFSKCLIFGEVVSA